METRGYEPRPELETAKEKPTLEKRVRDFFTAHRGEPGWDASETALGWAPRDFKPILSYIENVCPALRGNDRPELFEARQLIHEIDQIASPGGIKPTHNETEVIMRNLASDEFRIANNSAGGRDERDEAKKDHTAWINDIALYQGGAGIEQVLSRIEYRIYLANKSIDIETCNNKPNKKSIDAERVRLKAMRRARAQLLNEYFAPGSLH